MLKQLAGLLGMGLLLAGCGDDSTTGDGQSNGAAASGSGGSSSSGGKTSGSGGGSATGFGGGGITMAGASPSAKGWMRAFASNAGAISCDSSYEQILASNTPRLKFGDTEVFVGFQQYGNNQDPVFRRFDKGVEAYCEHHEKESPDGRALGFTWDGGPMAYVVYTIVGGGSAFDSAARGGWLDHYGDGGGSSKVTVVSQVELQFGTVSKASFIVARRQDGTKTNTLTPVAAPTVTARGEVEILGGSAYAPLNADFSPMCSGSVEYPSAAPGNTDGPSYIGRLSANLSQLVCAQTWSCGNVKAPCLK